MKQNVYYRSVFVQTSYTAKVIVIILMLMEIPTIIPKVFLRNNMGERYFSLFLALLVAFGLYSMASLFQGFGAGMHNTGSYYTFLVIYVIVSVLRYFELRQAPSVFDFAKFSLSHGDPHAFFRKIKLFGKEPSERTIDVFYEPIFCFLIGIGCLLLSQTPLGLLIIFCSICYFIANMYAAKQGDNFIMDMIDEIICNQDLSTTFVQNKDTSPRGVPFYGKKPSSEKLRQNLADQITNDDDDAAIAV